jgi:hypothetical protein
MCITLAHSLMNLLNLPCGCTSIVSSIIPENRTLIYKAFFYEC